MGFWCQQRAGVVGERKEFCSAVYIAENCSDLEDAET